MKKFLSVIAAFTFTIKNKALKNFKDIYVDAYIYGVSGVPNSENFVSPGSALAKVKTDSSKYVCKKTLLEKKHKDWIDYIRYSCNTCGATFKTYCKYESHFQKYGSSGFTTLYLCKKGTIPARYKYTWSKRK